jgi:hypothetical protein
VIQTLPNSGRAPEVQSLELREGAQGVAERSTPGLSDVVAAAISTRVTCTAIDEQCGEDGNDMATENHLRSSVRIVVRVAKVGKISLLPRAPKLLSLRNEVQRCNYGKSSGGPFEASPIPKNFENWPYSGDNS